MLWRRVMRRLVPVVAAIAIVGSYSAWRFFESRPRWVLVRDSADKPIVGVRVTLSNDRGQSISYTGPDGVAFLDRTFSEERSQLFLERDGYKPKTVNYRGGLSLLENLVNEAAVGGSPPGAPSGRDEADVRR
jgi:hypothetical protein